MTRKALLLELLLTAAAVAATWIVFPRLPAAIPVHWDLHGQANGFAPAWTLFLMGPGMMALITLLTLLVPWLSPRHFEVDRFRSTYGQIMATVFALVTYLYAMTAWAALGNSVRAGRAILGGVCLFIALLGNVLGKVRRNFFIGVRTPWTLTSERVWNATHRFAAKTFTAGGLVGLFLVMLGLDYWTAYALAAAALAPVLYSLVYSKQLERRGEL